MHKILSRALASAAILLTFILAPAPASAASLYDEVKERGELVVGVKNDWPPAGYIDEKNEWVGFDVDLAKYIADKLGVSLRLEPITSRTRIPMLLNGNVDVIVNLNPTRERAKAIDFTQPYFITGTTLLVRKGSGINGPADLDASKTVASVQGSSDAQGLLSVQPNANITYYQEYPQAYMAFKLGRVDAMVTTSIVLGKLAKDDPDFEILMPPFKPDPWVMGVKHDDSKWRLALDELIMDAWHDGTINELHKKYLETPAGFELQIWPDYY